MPAQRFRTGDIRVMGLVFGTHLIEDIKQNVPHGMVVTIPGDLAIRSKDLWRGIAQRALFQLPSTSPPETTYSGHEKESLESQIRDLFAQLKALKVENQSLRESLQSNSQLNSQKLDSILSALQNKVASFSQSIPSSRVVADEVADGTAPMFIPSEIRPKDVDIRIDVQGESIKSDMTNTADLLHKLKRGAKDS